jgi:sigma-B regulation protein RsbU (phosphoserine phosphatase)
VEFPLQADSPAPRAGGRALAAEEKYSLLLQISERISGTLDLDEILDHILDCVLGVVAYDAAGIFVLTREAPTAPARQGPPQLIAGMAQRGFPSRPREDDEMLRRGQGIVGHVIRTGQCVVAPDVRRDLHYVVGRAGTLSEIAIPIVMRGRTIGALNLESDAPGAYTDADLDVLRFFARAAAISIEKAMLHRQAVERLHIQGQLQIAHDVQSRLLPERDIEIAGYDLAGMSVPAYDIGGDYYDYIPLGDGRLGVVVADVAGKGIPAALIMATFRALLRTSVRQGSPLAQLVAQVNRLLAESIGLPAFVTAVYGVLEPDTGGFAYANCGHLPPLLVREDGTTEQLLGSGPCLGVFESAAYEPSQVELARGDLLLLYTDGVVEAEGDDGHEFGVDRLAALVAGLRATPAAEVIRGVAEATREFAGTGAYQDDFTLVAVRRRARAT